MWHIRYCVGEDKPDEYSFTDRNWVRVRKDFERVDEGWQYQETKIPKDHWELYEEIIKLRKEVAELRKIVEGE